MLKEAFKQAKRLQDTAAAAAGPVSRPPDFRSKSPRPGREVRTRAQVLSHPRCDNGRPPQQPGARPCSMIFRSNLVETLLDLLAHRLREAPLASPLAPETGGDPEPGHGPLGQPGPGPAPGDRCQPGLPACRPPSSGDWPASCSVLRETRSGRRRTPWPWSPWPGASTALPDSSEPAFALRGPRDRSAHRLRPHTRPAGVSGARPSSAGSSPGASPTPSTATSSTART